MKINKIELKIIFNSFGDKTVEATINGKFSASSPHGISKSSFRAREVDVKRGVKNFNKIKNIFIGSFTQEKLDKLLMKNISKLGTSVTTAISLAFFNATFKPKTNEFPRLLGNVLGGGSFSIANKSLIEIQEILTIPMNRTIPESVETNFLIWKEVSEKLKRKGKLLGLNPESGWMANITNEEALYLVTNIAESYGARVGIDFAASHIFKKGKYVYHDKKRSREEHIDYVIDLIKTYKLLYVEDPIHENDPDGYREIKKRTKALICGDDLTATHPSRVLEMVRRGSINSVLIKPNQSGNVTDCLKIIEMSKENNTKTVVSHRSKETCSPIVARLSLMSDLAKFGVAGIRICKLNELMRLWNQTKNPRMKKLKL